jgi:hypothetical protein
LAVNNHIPILIILSLSGCIIGNNKYPKPKDLTPSWLVDKPRVLGVRADPPEIAPGELAVMESLVVGLPEDEQPQVVWLACPPADPNTISFGCAADLASVDLDNATPEELIDQGFIGFEPFWPPTYTATADALDGVEQGRERTEGLQVMVQIAVIPSDAEASADVDFNDVEIAYKRLVVSEAVTPNHNPGIDEFTVDGVPVAAGSITVVDPEQSYDLGLLFQVTAIEDYTYVNRDGGTEERTEEPYATWYATGGTVVEAFTLLDYIESTWTAPEESGESGSWWAVVRDRRGGMSWIERRWQTR